MGTPHRLNLDDIHREALRRKQERVAGLQALIDSHEMFNADDQSEEHLEYMRELRRKQRAARVQLEAMRP